MPNLIGIDDACSACSVFYPKGFSPQDNRGYCPDCQDDADRANYYAEQSFFGMINAHIDREPLAERTGD